MKRKLIPRNNAVDTNGPDTGALGYGSHIVLNRVFAEIKAGGPPFRYIVLTIEQSNGNSSRFEVWSHEALDTLLERELIQKIDRCYDQHEMRYISQEELARKYLESLTYDQLMALDTEVRVRHLLGK